MWEKILDYIRVFVIWLLVVGYLFGAKEENLTLPYYATYVVCGIVATLIYIKWEYPEDTYVTNWIGTKLLILLGFMIIIFSLISFIPIIY